MLCLAILYSACHLAACRKRLKSTLYVVPCSSLLVFAHESTSRDPVVTAAAAVATIDPAHCCTRTHAHISYLQVTRGGGAATVFSPDQTAAANRLSPWGSSDKTTTATTNGDAAKNGGGGGGNGGRGASASDKGGGGSDSTNPTLSAAEKSAMLKRMILVSFFMIWSEKSRVRGSG